MGKSLITFMKVSRNAYLSILIVLILI